MPSLKVNVIIPVYNARETIRKCVGSVLENDYDNFEVIIVDDCSTDGTLEIIQGINDGRLRILTSASNSGAAFSRNFGVKNSEGDLILFLDADSYIDKDWVGRHVRLHKAIEADIIGGSISSVYRTMFGKCDGFCNWWTSIPYSKGGYVKKLHLPTNNISICRAVFDKIGYLDENLMTGEDAEFCYRALKSKIKIYLKSDLTAYHYEKDTLVGFLRHQGKWGRHVFRIRKKHKMDYHYLLPNSYTAAYLYVAPLAFLLTAFVLLKWLRYRPSVLFYAPLIFIGKLSHAAAIKDAFIEYRRFERLSSTAAHI